MAGVGAALAVVATLAAPVTTSVDCDPVPVEDVSDGIVTDWLAHGWTSDPTDHMEAVYRPGCR